MPDLRKAVYPLPVKIDIDAEKTKLGEYLFFEKALSFKKNVSCGTCHDLNSKKTGGKVFSEFSDLMDYDLDVPGIFNSTYNTMQFRNGRSHQDQELLNTEHRRDEKSNIKISEIIKRLSENKKYRNLFEKIYSDGITGDNIKNSLNEFLKTLYTPNSRFDRFLRGELELSDDEKEGYNLFLKNGCINCHQGINLGGNMVHYLGAYKKYYTGKEDLSVEDYGLFNATGWEEDKFKFKVPSLRNVAVTGPYLHDGSVNSLDKTVRIMAEYQLGTELSEDEIKKIVIFLRTLTGDYAQKKI